MSKYEKLWSYIKKCDKEAVTLTFDDIVGIADVPIDHSFLQYKKELIQYGWEVGKISMKERTVLFVKCKKTH